jgi:DNA helicase-2/ATP-dependent DNA helicase PcrA
LTDADAVLNALDPEQREVALATRGPVCVLAGAGTGKTRAGSITPVSAA